MAIVTVIVQQPGALNATAQVHSPTFDPVLANNVVTFTGQAFSEADVLVYHEPLLPLLVGNEVTMAVVVTNRGNILAPRVEMLVAFSLNVELLASQLSRGNHYLAPPGVVCNLGDLPPGAHARLTVTLRPARTGLFVSQAGVLSPATSPHQPQYLQPARARHLRDPRAHRGPESQPPCPVLAAGRVRLSPRVQGPSRGNPVAPRPHPAGGRGRPMGRELQAHQPSPLLPPAQGVAVSPQERRDPAGRTGHPVAEPTAETACTHPGGADSQPP
ncbi:MAG: hypothetical protein M5U12_03215 [Verrucomicrobia bacterium]|nr:hypothetical protein [Verrucomicrobiota bacterium]